MELSKNPKLQQALNQAISDWEIKNFVVMSKASMIQVGSLEGSLRLGTDEAVTIKFISLESLLSLSDDDELAKIIQYAKSGRLGGTKVDGTMLFHEEIAKHLNNNQTVIFKNKSTGEVDTRQITVEAISDINYKLVQAILAPLIGDLAVSKDEKEEKIKPFPDTPSRYHASARHTTPSSKNNAVKKMEMKLNEISTGQDQKSKEAREKEKAEQKEQKRRSQEQKELRKENLKWDNKQAAINKESRHDSK